MGDVRVDATVAHQTQEMQAPGVFLCVVEGTDQSRALRQCATTRISTRGSRVNNTLFLDRQLDSNNILVDNTTTSDIQMTDLAVTHQAVRQTNRKTGSIKRRECRLLCQLSHDRGHRSTNRVTSLGIAQTPTIDDNQRSRLHHFLVCTKKATENYQSQQKQPAESSHHSHDPRR